MSIMLFSICLMPAEAGDVKSARLYNVYADNMLFQRDTDAVLAGEATDGSRINAELIDGNGTCAASGETTAKNGCFTVSFRAPAGGYDTYTVKVSCNDEEFASLKGIVFGELWLSAGQSNMEYPLLYTPEGKEMKETGKTGPKNVHVLYLPGATNFEEKPTRYLPQKDAIRCSWFTADDPQVYNMSAPAFFFAEKLREKLDMPVGIMSVAFGGSCIAPWLSREAIDGNETVKKHLTDYGEYYNEQRWSSPNRSYHIDMTNIYNTNIAPLINFRPQGVIWYQGCSEITTGKTTKYYHDCFNLLQDSYTRDFAYTGGRLPFIFSQLACYDSGQGPLKVPAFNDVFTELAAEDPSSRAMTPIYDISLEFNELGAIHPMWKKPVGERMFMLAESLVYGAQSPSCAPVCKKSEAKEGSVYLTFDNAGDGLRFKGDTPRGFAVCGEDGICVEAQAELVSEDTVRVFSPFVGQPVAATYAAGSWSERANLWSTFDGGFYLPASAFGFSSPAVKHHYIDNAWMNCDDLTFFRSCGDSGYVNSWNTSGCSVTVDKENKIEGDGALRIKSQKSSFEFSPNISSNGSAYDNIDSDWSDYGTLRLQVKNCGKEPVRIKEIRIYKNRIICYTPVCTETGNTGATVPADGEWHLISFDLNRLRLNGIPFAEMNNGRLSVIGNIRFITEGENADLLLDDIRVLPGETGTESVWDSLQNFFDRIFESIKTWFNSVFENLSQRFRL